MTTVFYSVAHFISGFITGILMFFYPLLAIIVFLVFVFYQFVFDVVVLGDEWPGDEIVEYVVGFFVGFSVGGLYIIFSIV